MERMDNGLPFMLRYENVAWYKDGKVRILDRRVYPREVKFVECQTYQEVVRAIKDMVTQSAGPYTAAGMAMAQACYQAANLKKEDKIAFIDKAAYEIANARPTTANRMKKVTDDSLKVAKEAIKNNEDPANAVKDNTIDSLNRRYAITEKIGYNLCKLIPDNSKVLTQCFGETIVGMMTKILKQEGKNVEFYCCETRPYYQGARLTATCISEMGFPTTVITDNQVAYIMDNIGIDVFTCAADSVTCDGHVANKIGTYQISILCDYFGVPCYVTDVPDVDKKSKDDITIEMRDSSLMLEGRTAKKVKGIYPSFDITPPQLITGIVTDKDTYRPEDLYTYFKGEVNKFY
jgi:translation initiation factor IF-2B subunit alpha